MTFASLFGCYFLATVLHVSGFAVAALLLRVRMEEFVIFFWPWLLKTKIGGVEVKLGALPLGGYVKFSEESYYALDFFRQLLIQLAGPAVLFVTALLTIGWEATVNRFTDAYVNMLRGAISPLGLGPRLLQQAFEFAARHDLRTVFGHFTTIILAVQLIPLPNWNGGNLILHFLRAIFRWQPEQEMPARYVGLLLGLLWGLSWFIALVVALVSSNSAV